MDASTNGNGHHVPFKAPSGDDHYRISALFLGPKAENHEFLKECFNIIVEQQRQAREAYFPNDKPFIPPEVQVEEAFTNKQKEIKNKLIELLKHLGEKSIPFFSPRYSAHMSVDQSLPAILGYLSTMFYNPNNVTFEASPLTTLLELEVGEDLCEMMGYERKDAWGHITCDGTVANIESIWASRNLKFYPFALCDAMASGNELEFISGSFKVRLWNGREEYLKECSVWEKLNLSVSTILDIPRRLSEEYAVTSDFLERALKKYLVQSTGLTNALQRWGIKYAPTIVAPRTRHYSWPKGAALAGIGSENLVDIDIDIDARMDIAKLQDYLLKCAREERPVYQVVAVMGTTEEGTVDRLKEIIKLREELYEQHGLSFTVHADAAWGGYFASMLPPKQDRKRKEQPISLPPFVPHVGLMEDTAEQLSYLGEADSITVDPHKAGYVPYPAGGLCYKASKMKHLVTWTAPYISQGSAGLDIGTYGVEGSKPGAAASAVYLAHQVIKPDQSGYGVLLGEASFTCRKFAARWATLSMDSKKYIVVPLNRLPSEKKNPSDAKAIRTEKELIRDRILAKSNRDLVKDKKAMKLLNQLGSDLNINAFVCNFVNDDGTLNTDVEEANHLNRRLFERFSVTTKDKDPRTVPFYITSTTFAEEEYGDCVKNLKERLGLVGHQDLFVLRNVVMSPFTTEGHFLGHLMDVFQAELDKEVENSRQRNQEKAGRHTFVVQGQNSDKLTFVYLPSFHKAGGRRQIIFSAELSAGPGQKVPEVIKGSTGHAVALLDIDNMKIDDLSDGMKEFEAQLEIPDRGLKLKVNVQNVKIIKRRSLESKDQNPSYPKLMPFYLYGSLAKPRIEHTLLRSSNIQLSAVCKPLTEFVEIPQVTDADMAKGVIAVAQDIHEAARQPFPPIEPKNVPNDFFFRPGEGLFVKFYRDPYDATYMGPIDMNEVMKHPLGSGRVTIADDVYVDSTRLNKEFDPEAAGGAHVGNGVANGKAVANGKHDVWCTPSEKKRKAWFEVAENMNKRMKTLSTV